MHLYSVSYLMYHIVTNHLKFHHGFSTFPAWLSSRTAAFAESFGLIPASLLATWCVHLLRPLKPWIDRPRCSMQLLRTRAWICLDFLGCLCCTSWNTLSREIFFFLVGLSWNSCVCKLFLYFGWFHERLLLVGFLCLSALGDVVLWHLYAFGAFWRLFGFCGLSCSCGFCYWLLLFIGSWLCCLVCRVFGIVLSWYLNSTKSWLLPFAEKEPRKQQIKKLVADITIVMMIMAIMSVIMISTGCGFCGFWTKKTSWRRQD